MGQLISKARQQAQSVYEFYTSGAVRYGSRNTVSDFIPNAPAQYGQPPPQMASIDAQALITAQRMREIVERVGTPAACLNAVLDYGSGVELDIRAVDPSKPLDPERVAFVKQFMRKPNGLDSGLAFKQKLIRDLFTIGYAAIEIEKGPQGHIANLNVIDASRLRMDFEESGKLLGYNMLDIRGMPTSRGNDSPYAWLADEVVYMRRDPMSTSTYSNSRVTQFFTYAIIEDLIHHFISMRFTDSNIPRGVYDLGEISPIELQQAVANWNSQVDNAHKIVITGSRNGGKWQPMIANLKDLEAPSLIDKIQGKIMNITGVTEAELGGSMDLKASGGWNLSYTFKKRALEPILQIICEGLTTDWLWRFFGFTEMEYYFHEIDSRDEMVVEEIDAGYEKQGVLSINQIRNRRGDVSVPGGEDLNIFTGSAWIPVDMVREYADAQLEAIRTEIDMMHLQMHQMLQAQPDDGGGGQPPKPPVSLPIIRQPGFAEKFTTPGGAGSSTPKFAMPKPTIPHPKHPEGAVPRGGKQTAQRQGFNRSEMTQGAGGLDKGVK